MRAAGRFPGLVHGRPRNNYGQMSSDRARQTEGYRPFSGTGMPASKLGLLGSGQSVEPGMWRQEVEKCAPATSTYGTTLPGRSSVVRVTVFIYLVTPRHKTFAILLVAEFVFADVSLRSGIAPALPRIGGSAPRRACRNTAHRGACRPPPWRTVCARE